MSNDQRKTEVWDVDPISSILQRVHFSHTRNELRSISILSEHRNEGKTTVAMLLARGLTEVYKLKVLLVDLNPDGDAMLNQYLSNYENEKSNDGILHGHPFSFGIFRLKNIDMNWLKTAYDGLYANQLISSFSSTYDLIIVDTMTSINPNETSLRVSTQSNIIVTTEKSFGKTANKLQIELEQNRKEVLGIIFNK